MSKVNNLKVVEPYASALMDLAISTHTLDLITADMNDLLTIFDENTDLYEYIINPRYSVDSKKAIFEKILVPRFFNHNTLKFIKLLIDRNRISLFPSIAERYLQKVYAFVDIQVVTVVSAFPLSKDNEESLRTALRQFITAYELKIVTEVDKKLLGGFQITFDSYVIDASLRSQLRQLAAQLDVQLV